ncbi:MAG TPA: SRPBCC family protein [Myxococcales bacterium]|nr:SRPBCC family protein [Myxococcales bacterium]
MGHITVKDTILIAASPETVWDFTQDYDRRPPWDTFVREARVESESPRVVWIRSPSMTCRFRYKLDDRPRRTSLAIADVEPSWLIGGGGGSWVYEAEGDGTRWTSTATVAVDNRVAWWLLRPFLRWQLARSNRQAMRKAKAMIEVRPT